VSCPFLLSILSIPFHSFLSILGVLSILCPFFSAVIYVRRVKILRV
jgi:hypothetical protein